MSKKCGKKNFVEVLLLDTQTNIHTHTFKWIHTYKHICLCGKKFLPSLPSDYWYYGEGGDLPTCIFYLAVCLHNKFSVGFIGFSMS